MGSKRKAVVDSEYGDFLMRKTELIRYMYVCRHVPAHQAPYRHYMKLSPKELRYLQSHDMSKYIWFYIGTPVIL